MRRLILVNMVGGIALAVVAFAAASPAQPSASHSAGDASDSSVRPAATNELPPMPPLPTGESTILGGAIRNIDPVLDQFTLNIVAGRPITIRFDERTKLFRDGKNIPLRELSPADHTAVQTALDGTHVFAESIHILSKAPQGECQGVVRSFSPGSGKLDVDSDLSPGPVKFFVPANAPIVRVGQPEFASAHSGLPDLRTGSLVAITFAPDLGGRAVASHITVLAVPGSRFIFGGNVSYLDLASGSLVLVDSRDGKSYRIYFNPYRFPSVSRLHLGDNVTVTASFNGARYLASAITIN
jgi:hypothetical protein